jgi:hypothetical protein
MPSMHFAAIKGLGPMIETSALGTIDMNALDWEVLNTFVLKCDLCKLLVDLRRHWADEP